MTQGDWAVRLLRLRECLADLVARWRPVPWPPLESVTIQQEDRIYWYESSVTGRPYPVYVFGGDTDMATQGKVSLTSVERPEVVVTMLQAGEGPGDWDRIEARVNGEMHRCDLRVARLRESLQRGWYEPVDIHDRSQPATLLRIQRTADFLRRGGVIAEP